MGKSVKEGIMPKEFIHNRWFGQTARSHGPECIYVENHDLDTCPGQQVALDSGSVKVGWDKDHEHVEMAVVEMVDGAFMEYGLGDIDPENYTGPRYIQMDRNGLNRLIRTLRKARDDAFGRDE